MKNSNTSVDASTLQQEIDDKLSINIEDNQEIDIEQDSKQDQQGTSEYTDEERLAMSRGWRPKEEFDGDPEDFRSARQFNKLTKVFEEKETQRTTIKRLEDSMKRLTELTAKQHKALMGDRAEYYAQQKREAIKSGNVEVAEQFEKYHREAKEAAEIPEDNYSAPVDNKSRNNQPPPHHAEVEFVNRHRSWLTDNNNEESKKMRDFAVSYDQTLLKNSPSMDPQDRINEVEGMIRKLYPHRFENMNRSRAQSVNVSNATNSSLASKKSVSKKVIFAQLPARDKAVVREMARVAGIDDLDTYAQQIYDLGDK